MLCDVLKETLNDVNLICDESGLKLMAMDGSHVALVNLKLNASKFEYYHCVGRIQIGLNMGHLFKIIKTVTNLDIRHTFFITSNEQHEFGIEITNSIKTPTPYSS